MMSKLVSQKSVELELSTEKKLGNIDSFIHHWNDELPTPKNHPRKNSVKNQIRKSTNTSRLKEVFDEVDLDHRGTLTLDKFKAAASQLKLDLTEKELGRLFINSIGEEEEQKLTSGITFEDFTRLVKRSIFFQSIISNYKVTHQAVVQNYDYNCSTYINYRHKNYIVENKFGTSNSKKYDRKIHGQLHGQFKQFRAEIDYSWHTNYTKERQIWQDNVVKGIALRQAPQTHPWLVFTCGAMGSGKGYALRWMSSNNIFPLEEIVHIDPDHCKSLMPEWKGYVEANSLNAGGLCHKESGFIQELCEKVSLICRQNTWIDGSLADHGWWSQWINICREKFPWYRIAIFYIYCTPDKVFERALARGKKTGRYVPNEILQSSIDKTAKSVEILGPMADFLAIINNNESVPKLDRFEDRSHSFRAISLRFKQHFEGKEMMEFPFRLTRMKLLPVKLENFKSYHLNDNDNNTVTRSVSSNIFEDLFNMPKNQVFKHKTVDIVDNIPKKLTDTYLTISAIHQVNLDPQSRKVAGIPAGEMSFAWCAGVSPLIGSKRMTTTDAQLADSEIELHNPLHRFLISGGYIYFSNDTRKIVAVTASFAGFEREKWLTGLENWLSVDFDKWYKLPKVQDLTSRWVDTTDVTVIKNGGSKISWLLPNELHNTPFGAFAFKIDKEAFENGNDIHGNEKVPRLRSNKSLDDLQPIDTAETSTIRSRSSSRSINGSAFFFGDDDLEMDIYFPVVVSK